MPRQPTITIEDVVSICDRLIANGRKPTPHLILQEHGSGGLGTIYRLFRQWESRHESSAQSQVTLSPVLQKAIQEFMLKEVGQHKAELEFKLADSLQRADELARDNERQVEIVDEQSEQLIVLQDSLALLQGQFKQLEQDLVGAREEALEQRVAAENARTEVTKDRLKLEAMPKLEAELVSSREALEVVGAARIVAELEAAVFKSQRDGLLERLAEAKQRIDELERVVKEASDRERKLAAELVTARVAIEAGNARLEQANRSLAGAKEVVNEARSRERKAIEEAAELRGASRT